MFNLKLFKMKEIIDQLKAECANFIAESEKSSKAAQRRMRKATLNIAKLGKEFRKLSIEEEKKA